MRGLLAILEMRLKGERPRAISESRETSRHWVVPANSRHTNRIFMVVAVLL